MRPATASAARSTCGGAHHSPTSRQFPFTQRPRSGWRICACTRYEQWASACIACGDGRDAIATLRDERNRNPLRERLTELLMAALAQDNRQADALAAYDSLRTVLVEELGADPSAAVREMHANVLSQAEDRQVTTLRGHHGLPELTDSFVGREHDVREVFGLLADRRLVTLIGTGGAGKTRLAVEVARRVDHAGGVVFVDAAPLTAAGLIPDRLARALGISPGPGQSVLEALSRAVGTQDLLVVIDNLEHLPGAAEVVVDLLRRGSGIRVLATSRTRLNARGEHVHPVPPLDTTDTGGKGPPAATLFIDRAVAADPSFPVDADGRAAVDEICRRLDGLPLAIELAASRVRTVPPDVLVGHLDRAIDMLTARTGERPERHRTLRATIRWSYDLLPTETQATFRALTVFRGGWTPDAAMAVTGCPDDIIQLAEFETLLDASLIELVERPSRMRRFRMLETIRDFGAELLSERGEAMLCRDLHAEYVASFVELAEPHLLGPDQGRWLDGLDADRDNISSAASWLLATDRLDQAARLAIAAWRFWHLRSHLQEGREICQAVLRKAAGAALDPSLRSDLLSALGGLTYWHRDYAEAHRWYRQALDVSVADDNRAGVAAAHYSLGFTAFFGGRVSEAEGHFDRALEEYTALSDRLASANALAGLAVVDRAAGEHDRARQRAYEALEVQTELGDQFNAVNTLGLIGSIEARGGDIATAEDVLKQALRAHDRIGNTSGIVWMLHELAATAYAGGSADRAVVLSAVATSMEGEAGSGVGSDVLGLTEPIEAAMAQLGIERASRQQAIGRRLTREEAIAFALSDHPVPGPTQPVRAQQDSNLQPRDP